MTCGAKPTRIIDVYQFMACRLGRGHSVGEHAAEMKGRLVTGCRENVLKVWEWVFGVTVSGGWSGSLEPAAWRPQLTSVCPCSLTGVTIRSMLQVYWLSPLL
jgi:hypothetical protein